MEHFTPRATLVTGAAGHIGRLVTAALLTREGARVVALLEASSRPDAFLAQLRDEMSAAGRREGDLDFSRLTVVPGGLDAGFGSLGVDEIIHCAGCPDQFDLVNLIEMNTNMTKSLVELGKRLGVHRFVHVSSAFSSGLIGGPVTETAHSEPKTGPTEYFRAKWMGEQIVASSGIPFLILRPAALVGDSRSGRYSGGRNGIYQVWNAAERFLCREYLPVIHVVARRRKVHLLHQDAFQAAFLGAYRELPAGSYMHLVSKSESLPTVRDLYKLWAARCARPRELHFHDDIYSVPLETLDRHQKAFLDFVMLNTDVASHSWEFETSYLDFLRRKGVPFTDVTLETLSACQDRFVETAPRLREFLDANQRKFAPKCEFHEHE